MMFFKPKYREIRGDLFTYDGAIAHGCNCQANMGGGIAKLFAKRFSGLENTYIQECKSGRYGPGESLPWWDRDNGRWIYNLATQLLPGPNADLAMIDAAVAKMVIHAKEHEVREIGLPAIGSGIGGLDWNDVKKILKRHASRKVRFVVHKID